ncbi:class I SAM-dependent methyltransferase [Vibrio vulnificus]|uniref:class I SAM-dependent methyltransferase n=1 Tax=Vibrio vulnificus TaxID=672 RepID=UPI001028A465|nr:class I SAM-dependent methyltransferase [Vibrio vulnificus]EJE8737368.1 class I SAM-dependent methyltransferase [Vibrio vulnificus]EJL7831228.1 class I SAM-dependent methyltransferase [Vibrio vulnificus]EKA7351231.1 class I SAM-dependent methyltransferase [Vibrio vulnificus]MCU8220204.1 class I SAM-dependent methyltransferase [Vibrio vulnificus]RZR32720.1 class I SAM-dependent methyltransferase [Vibrio vulnificus]
MNETLVYNENTRPEMLDFLPENYSKVLEIGCWKGDFKSNLKEGCEYWGVELIENSANIAKKKAFKVICGDFFDVSDQVPDGYFDLIVCNDVIEHMPDHDKFLIEIKKKLNNKGVIVGSIPNVRYIKNLRDLIFKKDWKYKNAGLLDKTHLRWFTEKSLKRNFSQINYTIERFYGINSILNEPQYNKSIFIRLMIFIFGKDTQYMQFGFRVRSLD